MRFRPNRDGKIILLDREGNEVAFNFPVDAREALGKVDPDGKARYTLPDSSVVSLKQEVLENNAKKNLDRKFYREKVLRKGIKTTSGEPIPSEFILNQEEIMDEEFVNSPLPEVDNLQGDEKALDSMGFDDVGDEEKASAEKPKGRPGRKPAINK